MAMNKPGLAGEIKAKIEAKYGKAADDGALLQKFCEAVAEAVIDHITTNAQVTTAGTVTSGPGAGGSTAATGTIA